MSAGGGTSADLTGQMQSLWEEEEGLMGPSQLRALLLLLGSPAHGKSFILLVLFSTLPVFPCLRWGFEMDSYYSILYGNKVRF